MKKPISRKIAGTRAKVDLTILHRIRQLRMQYYNDKQKVPQWVEEAMCRLGRELYSLDA